MNKIYMMFISEKNSDEACIVCFDTLKASEDYKDLLIEACGDMFDIYINEKTVYSSAKEYISNYIVNNIDRLNKEGVIDDVTFRRIKNANSDARQKVNSGKSDTNK